MRVTHLQVTQHPVQSVVVGVDFACTFKSAEITDSIKQDTYVHHINRVVVISILVYIGRSPCTPVSQTTWIERIATCGESSATYKIVRPCIFSSSAPFFSRLGQALLTHAHRGDDGCKIVHKRTSRQSLALPTARTLLVRSDLSNSGVALPAGC